jgi:hypothetical protein
VGTVNLSNPWAIFAGSRPRFTRSRATYEAYAVSRTSTRPQVDSALISATPINYDYADPSRDDNEWTQKLIATAQTYLSN